MISMLIYSCKQDEIELLQEISKDMVAYFYDDRIETIVAKSPEDMENQQIDTIDIAFVDITEHCGLQAAKDLRKRFGKAEIIIISDNTVSPVLYLIPDIRAVSLLLKPLQNIEIQKVLKSVFSLLERNTDDKEKFFSFGDSRERRHIPYSQILYFEARNKRIYVRLSSREYGVCGTMDTLEEKLPENFKRCHRGYIVNLSYVDEIWYSRNFIVLKNNIEIPLSRSYKPMIKEVVKNGKGY